MRLFKSLPDIIVPSMIIFASSVIGNFTLFLVNLYLSNVLGPSNFGVFKAVLYFSTFLAVVVGLGFQPTLTRYISVFRVREKEMINHLIRWYLKLVLTCALLLGVTVVLLREKLSTMFLRTTGSSSLLTPAALIIFSPVISLFTASLLGYKKFYLYAVIQILIPLMITSVIMIVKNLGLFFIVLAWPIGIFLGNLPALVYVTKLGLFKYAKKFNVREIFINFGFPIYLLRLVSSVTSLIVPIISVFTPSTITGYYSFAFIFYNASLLLPNAVSSVLLPEISELNAKQKPKHTKRTLKDAFRFYTIFTSAVIIFTIFFSKQFISFVSPNYLESLLFFRCLLVYGALSGYLLIYNSYLLGVGNVKRVIALSLLQNLLLFVLTFFLLEYF